MRKENKKPTSDTCLWDSLLYTEKTEMHRIELTSAVTNRLLRHGIGSKAGYDKDVELLDKLFAGIKVNEGAMRGFKALPVFIPDVPEEIVNRYDAIKSEIQELNLDALVVGACGLSPLGVSIHSVDPHLTVYDTDLEEVVQYRMPLISSNPPTYYLLEWDLLSLDAPSFAGAVGKKVGVVVEGLTFYLDNNQRRVLNNNLQKLKEQISFDKPIAFIFDYYVSEQSAKQRDTRVLLEHPEWPFFLSLLSNVHESQKAFFKSREEIVDYLFSQNYKNVRVSPLSKKGNAHTIFVCEY